MLIYLSMTPSHAPLSRDSVCAKVADIGANHDIGIGRKVTEFWVIFGNVSRDT